MLLTKKRFCTACFPKCLLLFGDGHFYLVSLCLIEFFVQLTILRIICPKPAKGQATTNTKNLSCSTLSWQIQFVKQFMQHENLPSLFFIYFLIYLYLYNNKLSRGLKWVCQRAGSFAAGPLTQRIAL